MSISRLAKRRLIVRRTNAGLERGRVRGTVLLARVFDHEVDELHQMFAELAHADALNAGVGTLEQHPKEVGGEIRILESGGLTQTYDSFVLTDLVLLNDLSRRMFRIGKLRERVSQGRATLLEHLELPG